MKGWIDKGEMKNKEATMKKHIRIISIMLVIVIIAACVLIVVNSRQKPVPQNNTVPEADDKVYPEPKEVNASCRPYGEDVPWHDDYMEYIEKGGYQALFRDYLADEKSDLKDQVPVYEEKDLCVDNSHNRMFDDSSRFSMFGSLPTATNGLLFFCPTHAMRLRSDDTVYVMYDLDTGCRLYKFFLKNNSYVSVMGYPLLLSGKKITWSDMESIRPGMNADRIVDIDPAAEFFVRELKASVKTSPGKIERSKTGGKAIASLHYLSDGLVKVVYGESKAGELIISEIEYFADRCVKDYVGNIIDYSILEPDLP